jgi:hypothetical protein
MAAAEDSDDDVIIVGYTAAPPPPPNTSAHERALKRPRAESPDVEFSNEKNSAGAGAGTGAGRAAAASPVDPPLFRLLKTRVRAHPLSPPPRSTQTREALL